MTSPVRGDSLKPRASALGHQQEEKQKPMRMGDSPCTTACHSRAVARSRGLAFQIGAVTQGLRH